MDFVELNLKYAARAVMKSTIYLGKIIDDYYLNL